VSAILLLTAAACGPTAKGSGGQPSYAEAVPGGIGDPDGFVTYVFEKRIWRVEAEEGAVPVDLSAGLDPLGAGEDEAPAVSKSGAWMTLVTTRFGCSDQPCLVVVPADLAQAAPVKIDRRNVTPTGRAAISDDGSLIVFSWNDGPHSLDLFAIRREGQTWVGPTLLTGSSPEPYNDLAVLSSDGERVLFDCGPVAYSQEGTDICEIKTDGTGFRKLVDSDRHPGGESGEFAVHHPDYAPEGAIVFEADWSGEKIWALLPGAVKPELLGDQYNNDNSPCVLPSGHIVSLWLGRPEGTGIHELKVMDGDGSDAIILTGKTTDVTDVGMSCHGG